MNYYAGIGSRKTPQAVLKTMRAVRRLREQSFVLRSVAAGADTAFADWAGRQCR